MLHVLHCPAGSTATRHIVLLFSHCGSQEGVPFPSSAHLYVFVPHSTCRYNVYFDKK